MKTDHVICLLKAFEVFPIIKTGKDPDAGKDWEQEENGVTEDETVRQHGQLNGHESEQAPGVGDGQGSLVCCSPWGRKESDMTEQLNNSLSVAVFLVQSAHWVLLEADIWPPHLSKFKFNSDNQGSNSRWTLVIRMFLKSP